MRARRFVLAGLLSALVCLGVSVTPALALEGYEPGTPASFGEPGSGAGQLQAPEGVAVNDTTGDVYVADVGNARIDEFEADGKFLRAWGWGVATGAAALETCTTTCEKGLTGTEPGEFTTPAFVAVDNSGGPSKEDVYVSDSGDHTVTKFTREGALVGSWGTGGQLREKAPGEPFSATETRGVAVDASGNVRVYDKGNLFAFTEMGVLIPSESFNAEVTAGETGSLALTLSGEMYYVEGRLGFSHAYKLVAGGEPFEIEQVRVTAVAVSPVSQDVLLDEGKQIALYTSITSGRPTPVQVFSGTGLAESRGIAAGPRLLYATQHAADNVEVFAFGPLKPRVEGGSVSGVGSFGVTLHAGVSPEGEPTSYFFEYGTTTGYGLVTPVESAGGGVDTVGVEAAVGGLSADTTYHFRVVASSVNGVSRGGDVSFSTFPVGVLGLPDGRGYELVSSLGNGDATVTGGVRAAGDGSAVAYLGQAPPVGGNGNSGNPNSRGIIFGGGDNEYFASRLGGGWSALDIQPGSFESVRYQGFSDDLSVGVLSSSEAVVAGAPDSEALYARDDRAGGYRLLGAGAGYGGATPDGGYLLVSISPGGLCESRGAELDPVNVLPQGGSVPNGVFGAPSRHENTAQAPGSLYGPDLSNVVSSDGSRVVWTEVNGEGYPERLFVREGIGSPGVRTVQVDVSRVPGRPGGEGRFATASGDGSRVFFTDCQPLTADSTAVPTPTPGCEVEENRGEETFRTPAGNDLYEYDLTSGVLTDLSVDSHAGKPANVVGVLGASADGSYVYFAAGGALAPGAEPQECVKGSPSEFAQGIVTKCNVYVVHDGGAPVFVAAVTSEEWADWATVVGDHQAYVASGSGVLVFDSGVGLTGFHNNGAAEIYMFTPGVGLSCVSCNPSGELTPPGTGARLAESGNGTYALRDISATGDRVFFDTGEGLVPQDGNGREDVYEWERDGSGSCARAAGCLYLLSGGTSTDNSSFVDASEDGNDVFIMTRAQLVPRDRGEVREIYDVRVGALPELIPPVCTGSGCQGVPAAPPIFATPSSATFNGVGNFPPPFPPPPPGSRETRAQRLAKALKACRKDRAKRKRMVCERTARKRFKAPQAKRAGVQRQAPKNRGAGS
jgi:hypothetical protein